MAMAWHDLAAAPGRAAVSTAGIAVGVAVLVVIAGLGLGVRDLVLEEVVQELPVNTIEVVPRTLNLGLFEVGAGSLFGNHRIGPELAERLGQLEGVEKVYPKLEVKIPMGARGGLRFFGRRLYTDLFMTGLPVELVQPEVGEAFAESGDVVPVVISDQLIEVYNASVAPTLGTPRLTDQSLTGFEFDLVLGRSLMLAGRGAKRVGSERARIVGTSRFALRLGVSVPLETARRLLETYSDSSTKEQGESYASLLVRARSASFVPAITEAVRAMGFSVDQTAQRTSDILRAGTLLASLVGLLVLLLAAMNIAHTFLASLSERRRELAILRAVGARRVDLVAVVLTQAALLGTAGGVAGFAMARVMAWTMDYAAATWLPDFPFKPATFFAMPWWLGAVALVAAVLAGVLGALWPAVRTARASVSRALAES